MNVLQLRSPAKFHINQLGINQLLQSIKSIEQVNLNLKMIKLKTI